MSPAFVYNNIISRTYALVKLYQIFLCNLRKKVGDFAQTKDKETAAFPRIRQSYLYIIFQLRLRSCAHFHSLHVDLNEVSTLRRNALLHSLLDSIHIKETSLSKHSSHEDHVCRTVHAAV